MELGDIIIKFYIKVFLRKHQQGRLQYFYENIWMGCWKYFCENISICCWSISTKSSTQI